MMLAHISPFTHRGIFYFWALILFMIEQDIFSGISEVQRVKLKDALGLITILVAGADGTIDEQELNWAEKLTHIRTYAEPVELNDFYKEVEADFYDRYKSMLSELSSDISTREGEISSRLGDLNGILNCLSNPVAYQLYTSFTSFAKHIAKASGGFLRFGSISSEEKRWINLPMLDPIILEMPEEEEEGTTEE